MARSAQYIDENGYLLVKGCPVSSPGIFDYSAAQVGETEADNKGDLNRIVRVFRPAAAINDPQFIETLKHVPMIDDHEFLIGDEQVLDAAERGTLSSPEEKGVDGIMTDNVYWNDPWLRADIKVFSRRMQALMRAGKRDLSLGYTSKFEYSPGVHDGMPYEYIQTTMRGNHIALVEEGRVPGARVLDGLVYDSMSFAVPSANNTNPESEKMDENMMARLTALLPVLEKLCGGGAAADPAAAVPAVEGEVAPGAEGEVVVPVAEDTTAVADPAADPAVAAPAEGAPAEILTRIEALVKQLTAPAAADPAVADPAAEPTDGDKPKDTDKPTEDSDDVVVPTGDEDDNEVVEDSDRTLVVDNVDGLRQDETNPQLTVDTADVPKASEGPKKGLNTDFITADAAFRSFATMAADRDQLARRLSTHIGTFDSSKMTPVEVAEYGCNKLGIKATGKNARIVLDGFLLGASRAAPAAAAAATRTADSSSTMSSDMAAYLNPSS